MYMMLLRGNFDSKLLVVMLSVSHGMNHYDWVRSKYEGHSIRDFENFKSGGQVIQNTCNNNDDGK